MDDYKTQASPQQHAAIYRCCRETVVCPEWHSYPFEDFLRAKQRLRRALLELHEPFVLLPPHRIVGQIRRGEMENRITEQPFHT